MSKQRYILMAGYEDDHKSRKMICGSVDNFSAIPFDPNYDFDKNEKNVFITNSAGNMNYILEMVNMFYASIPYPPNPIIADGKIIVKTKEDFDKYIRFVYPVAMVAIPNKED